MNHRIAVGFAASAASMVLALATGLGSNAGAAGVKTGGTLYTAMPWGTIADNFNPFLPSGSNAGGTLSAIYEPLFYDNSVNGQLVPLLGTGYKWEDHNLKLVITTRSGVKWTDGTSFTAQDVAFTFNYLRKYPVLDLSRIWSTGLTSVTASGPNTVTFTFAKANTPAFFYIAGQAVVPAHIWSKVNNPSTFTNPHPVGTGPFTLQSFSPYVVKYVKNPHYWMSGRPYIHALVIEAVKSNDTSLFDILKHNIQFTYTAITDVAKTFAARNPAVNHYWWPVNNTNLLYMNTQESPFSSTAFRRAVAEALNTKLIATRAYYGAIGPANQAALVPGQVKEWFNPALKHLEYRYSPALAKQTLKKAGFKWTSTHQLESARGNPLPSFRILVGAGWTDFITMAQVISNELQAIGISTTIDQEPWGTYESSLLTGRYDMAICWGAGSGPTPYYDYEQSLGSQYSAKQIGQVAVSDWSRFTRPVIDQALQSFRQTSNLAVQKRDLTTVARIILSEVPFVPLTNRPNFFDYQTATFVGFPNAHDPYNAGDPPDASGAELMYTQVHLK